MAFVIVPLEPPPLTFGPASTPDRQFAAAARSALKDNLRSLGLLAK